MQIGYDYVYQQDGAPSHTAASTQNYLTRNCNDFISKDEWPPNSPDLNPMDYGIWAAMQQKQSSENIQNVQQLKIALTRIWRGLSQRYISKLVRQFRPRLQLVIDNEGNNIEHLLNL
jgi:hypothetical protein